MPTVRKYSSISQETYLTAALTAGATTMSVANASILLAGITPAAGERFTVVIDPETALEEIVDVIAPSAPSSNTLTIVRQQDGSQAIAHTASAKVRHMGIGRDFREANEHINQTTGTAHGLVLTDVVETTDTGTVSTQMLASNAVTTDKISNASVTTAKVSDSAVTTAKIADGAITSVKIADGTIVAGDIADGAITSAKISDGTIVNADINVSAGIDKTKIAGTAVTQADSGTVTSNMIADGTIVNGDISASAAIAYSKLNLAGSITSSDIADGTIANADISPSAAISKSKLNLGGTITSADLVDGTIVAADIADGAITAAKMAVDPYARANHTGTQTASTISNFDAQVRTNRLDQMAAPTAPVSANGQKVTNLGLASSNGDAVSVAYLESQKGIANGIAPLDSNGKVPFDHIPATAVAEVFVVSSEAQMLAISGSGIGDIAIRSDINKSFILRATPGTVLSNWNELLTPIDSVLSVDGATGAVDLTGVYLNKTTGVLAGNLNANTHKVTNLGTPTNSADAATKAYVDAVAGTVADAEAAAAAAEAALDSFDDRYLGAKSTPPTLDNDGNALITGAIYWNTVTNAMYAWTGTEWGSISSTADIYRYRFTAGIGQTSVSGLDDNGLTLAYLPGKEQVYLNGVLLVRTTDYNASNGTSITSLAALAAGDVLEVITFTAFEMVDAINRATISTKGDLIVGVAASTPGALAVGGNGKFLKADSSTATGLVWDDVPNPDLTPYATITSVQTANETQDIMTIMGAY